MLAVLSKSTELVLQYNRKESAVSTSHTSVYLELSSESEVERGPRGLFMAKGALAFAHRQTVPVPSLRNVVMQYQCYRRQPGPRAYESRIVRMESGAAKQTIHNS